MPKAPGKIVNAEWHASNRLLRNARLEERVEWHIEHASECGCRKIPPSIATAIDRRTAERWPEPVDDPQPPRQTEIPRDAQHDGRPPHMNPSRPGDARAASACAHSLAHYSALGTSSTGA